MLADPWRSMRRLTAVGMTMLIVLAATIGLWGGTAPLAGAVIATGRVVVETNVRRIQHPTGGVVAEIRVKDGDRVAAGDLLVRLDETNARATLALIETELHRLLIRKARLKAQRDGDAGFQLPPDLAGIAGSADIVEALGSEQHVFQSRAEASRGQVSQLRERIAQSKLEIDGVTAQLAAKTEQKALINQELDGVHKLYDQNLVAQSRLTTLQREASRLSGEEGSLVAEAARIRGRIVETELQILQIDQDMRRTISEELRDVEGKVGDLSERRVAAVDQLNRIEIRAPQAGIVHQSTMHTIGGVIAAGEQLMLIIPETDHLVVEVRIEPTMIDRVHVGQDVLVRFPAFDAATTPSLNGQLQTIGADLTTDQPSGVSYYTARLQLDQVQLARLGNKMLLPGMPAETYIQTGMRTAFAYMLKPFQDQLARTFRYD